jgi:hypothetical protein
LKVPERPTDIESSDSLGDSGVDDLLREIARAPERPSRTHSIDALIGRSVAQFRIDAKLGEGGMCQRARGIAEI